MQGDAYGALWAKLCMHTCVLVLWTLNTLRPSFELSPLTSTGGNAPARIWSSLQSSLHLSIITWKMAHLPSAWRSTPLFTQRSQHGRKHTHICINHVRNYMGSMKQQTHVSLDKESYVWKQKCTAMDGGRGASTLEKKGVLDLLRHI